MGGAKKPTAGNKDKSAGSKDTKKKKDKGEGGPKKLSHHFAQGKCRQKVALIQLPQLQ